MLPRRAPGSVGARWHDERVLRSLAPYRLRAQRLVGDPLPDPAAVVRHLGAVQSQEHATVPWSIGRRCGADLQAVLSAPDVVRTHALRTTWHHVHLDDLPLVVAATGDRVMGQVVAHVRRLGMDERTLLAAGDVVARAVRSAPGCTRDDVAARLDEAGHPLRGDLLAHVVMVAELRGEVAGRRDPGGPHRYAPLDLAPASTDVDGARAWLARTYARGHGPVDAADLAWWSSLTLTQARRAVADAGLEPVEVHGETLWSDLDGDALEAARVEVPAVLLLSGFDELVSYARDGRVRAELGPHHDAVLGGGGILVVDGRLAGHWRRTVRATTLTVEVTGEAVASRRHRAALEAEAHAMARFLGVPDVDLVLPGTP